jgi:hypothetical protein
VLRKEIALLIVISLVGSPLISFGAFGYKTEQQISSVPSVETAEQFLTLNPVNMDPSITIVRPAAGYLYLFKLQPIQMTLASMFGLGYAVVVGRSITLDTIHNDIHHVKFVATQRWTGWETIAWDYQKLDGLGGNLGLTSGFYTISAIAYDETDQELASDSIKVFYLKIGREDFGIWVNTKYDGGETITTPLQLGMTDFASMLNTGESKQFSVSLQSKDDTNVDLRFTRTKIMNNTEKVVETKCNIITTCDTSKEYEVSVEIRFPFIMLEGGQPLEDHNPYFATKIGYLSHTGEGKTNHINTTVYIGRENISDPRIFRLSIKPEDIESGSKLTFFTSYSTVDGTGKEIFQRTYSIAFEPATELTITSIPREAKISYDFGRSAGVQTKITLRAEGGILDDILQSITFDPLPSYMTFDLTILGSREFLYESDRPYNISYSIDSIQNGNLVSFGVVGLPARISASWGLSLGTLGDLAASSYAELNMSEDVKSLTLSFFGNDRPFISLENFPRKLRFESGVNLLNGTGDITLLRGLDDVRTINITLQHKDMIVTKSFELKNNFVQMKWKIDLINHTGFFNVARDSESVMTFSTIIEYQGWTFTKALELRNNNLELSWEVNRQERTGRVLLTRDAGSGSSTLSFSIAHEGWVLDDTLEFRNNHLELFWQLPTQTNTHVELGLITAGGELFHNTISVVDNGIELFHLGFGIQTDDRYVLSWDYVNGHISNFQWSGRLFRLTDVDIGVNLAGELFTISAAVDVGESGSIELQFNKAVSVTFVNTAGNTFKIHGNVSINATRRLQLSWELGDTGYFTVYTFGQPLGDQFNLEVGYDPQHTGSYQYGFRLTGQHFVQITRTIQWYSVNGTLVRIWVLGDYPIPSDWTLQVLWNGQWFPVPWNASP